MVAEEHRSNLSEDEVDELARKIRDIVCEERPSLENKLESSVIYYRLLEEGIDLPDYAMHDALHRLKGWCIRHFLGGPQNPNVDTEAVRRHGGITIVSVVPESCDG